MMLLTIPGLNGLHITNIPNFIFCLLFQFIVVESILVRDGAYDYTVDSVKFIFFLIPSVLYPKYNYFY